MEVLRRHDSHAVITDAKGLDGLPCLLRGVLCGEHEDQFSWDGGADGVEGDAIIVVVHVVAGNRAAWVAAA